MRSGLYVYTNQILKHHVISLLKLKWSYVDKIN
jgi:hypothetical protein